MAMTLFVLIDFGTLCTANHDFTAAQPGQLSIKKGEELEITTTGREEADWYKVVNRKMGVGLVPASSVKIHHWFHGDITRAEAELTLSSEINGSFLVRKSQSKVGEYVLSLYHDRSTQDYRIQKDPLTSQYHINPKQSFLNLAELTAHHSKLADGLVTVLRYPAINPHKTSISREVDEWEVDRLDISTGQIIWENEHVEIYEAVIKKRGLSVAIKTIKVNYKVVYTT